MKPVIVATAAEYSTTMTYNTAKEREAAMRAAEPPVPAAPRKKPVHVPAPLRKDDGNYVPPLTYTPEERAARKKWKKGLQPASHRGVVEGAKKAGIGLYKLGAITVGKKTRELHHDNERTV